MAWPACTNKTRTWRRLCCKHDVVSSRCVRPRACAVSYARTDCVAQVALKQGADLVPLYHFGNTRLLSVLGKSLQRVSRATRLPWMILYGRFGLPIPRRSPLMVVRASALWRGLVRAVPCASTDGGFAAQAIGTPILIEKTMDESDPGFKDEVERLHKLFCAGVIDTFKKYRGVYDSSWADLPIKIVK